MKAALELDTEIHTERCRLRRPDETDFPHIWSATRVPGFNDGMLWDPPGSIDDLRGPLLESLDAWRKGQAYHWTVEHRDEGRFLGRGGLRREDFEDEWSIGFWIHPNEQRQGLATEVARALVTFGFERLGAQVVHAAHATWNVASKKAIERTGMAFVRVNPKGFKKRGVWVEEHEYAARRPAQGDIDLDKPS